MIIGVPKEIKNKENRVAITPIGVRKLVQSKHIVFVERNAGIGSGLRDAEYKEAGAKILRNAKAVYSKAEMIVKIKELISSEFDLVKPEQTIFTYLHLAASETLTMFLLNKKTTGVAYETIETEDHKLPLLEPMSQVAGKMSIQVGAHYLEKTNQGRGVLLGGTDTVKPAKVVVIGSGIAGSNAANIARGMGADVTVLDVDDKKIKHINAKKDKLFRAKKSTKETIASEPKEADLVIGAVLIPGAKAPKLVTRQMIKNMKLGSVIVDIAIDQGGCFETSKPTSHEHPIYIVDGVIHYCVTNMPGAVARTSTLAITNVTLPYIRKLANKGIKKAIQSDENLARGINTYDGKLTYKPVAEALNLNYIPLTNILK
ncbi:MAG: alanine dehydrogenase [bacterium]|nr:alanine dehydrogenase [bacterium]